MSNELVKIAQLPNNEIHAMAKQFYESGMFADMKSAAQAYVKIVAGQEIGIPPFAAMSGIHIIQGKPTIGAGLMAARIKGSGKYTYKVKQMDEKACSIDFFEGKDLLGNSTFTLEDAKRAQTKNLDKYPKNMLFARALSNGVKWYTPDIFSGPVYTPEELDGTTVTEDVTPVSVETAPPVKKQKLSKDGFDKAIARINTGEHDLFEKLPETFDLSKDQIEVLATAKKIIDEQGTTGA